MHLHQEILLLSLVGFAIADVLVTTPIGSVQGIRRSIPDSNKKISVFYGIPFAKPPIGKLRFKEPQPSSPWKGTLDATNKPNSCPQPQWSKQMSVKWAKKFDVTTKMSEDCLYLNIWTPTLDENGYVHEETPVIFWIHGGGYTMGGSMINIYDGTYLALQENLVFVSTNYRLGALGYLYLGSDDIPGNMALYDLNMALEWVQRNIAAFGGNPNKITIIGESAGGGSVSALLLSPVSRNKFQNAVIQSGTMFSQRRYKSKEGALKIAKSVAAAFGCVKETSKDWLTEKSVPADVADCLRQRYNHFEYITGNYSKKESQYDITHTATIDGKFFPSTPTEMLKIGEFNKDVNIMIGHTANEGSLYALTALPKYFSTDGESFISKAHAREIIKKILPPNLNELGVDIVQQMYSNWTLPTESANHRDNIVDFIGDYLIVCPNIAFALAASATNKVYYYQFDHTPKVNLELPLWTGAMHTDEIQFFLGSVLNKSYQFSDNDKRIGVIVMRQLANFARNGQPTQSGSWPQFTATDQLSTVYGLYSSRGSAVKVRECEFLSSTLPRLIKESKQEKGNSKEKSEDNAATSFTKMNTFINIFLLIPIFITLK